MTKRMATLFVLVALVAAACGGGETATSAGEDADAGTATTGTQPETEAADDDTESDDDTEADDDAETDDSDAEDTGTTVTLADSDLGQILTDGESATLYLFVPDDQSDSTCYDDCEQNWPPLLGPAEAGEGVDAALLGTVEREDGTTQVTYNDWPLYYFAGDSAPGDTAGQGVGDVWFVVDANGGAIEDTATSQGRGY